MSYEFYKVLHHIGLFMLFLGIGGLLFSFAMKVEVPKNLKSLGFMLHGFGLLVLLISGFGQLAKLDLMKSIPGWAFAKMGIWLLMGGMAPLIKKKGHQTAAFALIILAIGGLAATLAIEKPF